MNKFISEDHVLPRPVDRLPEYAHAKSRQALAERMVDAFKTSASSATAIAGAVVDPSAVRKAIGDPLDPETEKIAVPGGTLLGIRAGAFGATGDARSTKPAYWCRRADIPLQLSPGRALRIQNSGARS